MKQVGLDLAFVDLCKHDLDSAVTILSALGMVSNGDDGGERLRECECVCVCVDVCLCSVLCF